MLSVTDHILLSYRSRLSHDFYQVMAGKSDMTLHGLRQLVEWSIDHSCMEPDLMKEVRESWGKMWDDFCRRIVNGEFTVKDGAAENEADGAAEAPAAAVLPPV